MWRTLAIILLLAATLFAAAQPAYAISSPDSFGIETARGYGGVSETGDILLIIHYAVEYASVPSEVASNTIIGQYIDNATAIRSQSPFVFVNSGYGHGIIAIYFDADAASSASIVHGDSDSARLIGNPNVFPSPWQQTIPITWRTLGSQAQLEADIIEVALHLEEEADWSLTDLVRFESGSQVFQADGEDYFENSIPRLRQIAPSLFAATLTELTVVERDFGQSYQATLESAWDGSVLASSFSELASWLDMPETAVSTTLVLVGALAGAGLLAGLVAKYGVGTEAAAGLGVMAAAAAIGFAAFQGIFNFQTLAIIGLICIVIIAMVVFLKRA